MCKKWAVIGTDDAALKFARQIKNTPQQEVRAVATTDCYKALCFAKEIGAPLYYGDLNSLLEDKSIDFIYITQLDEANMIWISKLPNSGKIVIYERNAYMHGVG